MEAEEGDPTGSIIQSGQTDAIRGIGKSCLCVCGFVCVSEGEALHVRPCVCVVLGTVMAPFICRCLGYSYAGFLVQPPSNGFVSILV